MPDKPANPYPEGTLIWSVMEGDWEDLTVKQIAEVLDAVPNSVRSTIAAIKKRTGYSVPHTKSKIGRKLEI